MTQVKYYIYTDHYKQSAKQKEGNRISINVCTQGARIEMVSIICIYLPVYTYSIVNNDCTIVRTQAKHKH